MAKHKFEDFLALVKDEYKDFVTTVHEMLQDDFKARMRSTKNGLSISYSQPKVNRVVGFSFQKNELIIDINTEKHTKYLEILKNLPKNIEGRIDKAENCQKLIGQKCAWDTCVPGYDFHIGENHYQKCRYSCFKFNVDIEDTPFLLEIIKNEAKERKLGMLEDEGFASQAI